MYDTPNLSQMQAQLARQKAILERIGQKAGVKAENSFHYALLPQKLADKYRGEVPLITWESIAVEYAFLENDYFLQVLNYALEVYDKKVAFKGSSINGDGKLTGKIIFEEYESRGIKGSAEVRSCFQRILNPRLGKAGSMNMGLTPHYQTGIGCQSQSL
jgi:hypothetical protein